MNYTITDGFDKDVLLRRMMGPNAMRVAEEMAAGLPDYSGKRILDLGCGMGLSTYLLAKRYPGAQVVAADLWVDPAENDSFFREQGLGQCDTKEEEGNEDRSGRDREGTYRYGCGAALPLKIDATAELPFAKQYFDLIFSVDSYHYFGANEAMLPKLLSYLAPGGKIAVAVPGLHTDWGTEMPGWLKPYYVPDMHFYSCGWWRALWERAADVEWCRELDCFRQAWEEWLQSDNEYAIGDRGMMRDGGFEEYNLVGIVAGK